MCRVVFDFDLNKPHFVFEWKRNIRWITFWGVHTRYQHDLYDSIFRVKDVISSLHSLSNQSIRIVYFLTIGHSQTLISLLFPSNNKIFLVRALISFFVIKTTTRSFKLFTESKFFMSGTSTKLDLFVSVFSF